MYIVIAEVVDALVPFAAVVEGSFLRWGCACDNVVEEAFHLLFIDTTEDFCHPEDKLAAHDRPELVVWLLAVAVGHQVPVLRRAALAVIHLHAFPFGSVDISATQLLVAVANKLVGQRARTMLLVLETASYFSDCTQVKCEFSVAEPAMVSV